MGNKYHKNMAKAVGLIRLRTKRRRKSISRHI